MHRYKVGDLVRAACDVTDGIDFGTVSGKIVDIDHGDTGDQYNACFFVDFSGKQGDFSPMDWEELHEGMLGAEVELAEVHGWYFYYDEIRPAGPLKSKEERVIDKIHELNARYQRHMEFKRKQHEQ